ncbi:hypothetical protein ACKWTF_012632 [Chironomus riparius]
MKTMTNDGHLLKLMIDFSLRDDVDVDLPTIIGKSLTLQLPQKPQKVNYFHHKTREFSTNFPSFSFHQYTHMILISNCRHRERNLREFSIERIIFLSDRPESN